MEAVIQKLGYKQCFFPQKASQRRVFNSVIKLKYNNGAWKDSFMEMQNIMVSYYEELSIASAIPNV